MSATGVGGVRRTSAVDAVVERLEARIATGELSVGDPLPSHAKLAEEYGVSRNTVREAVNKLAVLGLVTVRHGVGTLVSSRMPADYTSSLLGHFMLKPVSVAEFLEVRLLLERNAARLAATRADEAQLATIRSAWRRQAEALARRDAQAFIEEDAAFHLAIAEASGNAVLAKFLSITRELLERFVATGAQEPGAVEQSHRRHESILQGLEDRDPRRAQDEVATHLREAAEAAQRRLGIELDLDGLFGT